MCFRGSKNQQNVPCIQTKDADQEREYKAWAKGRVQSESENETKSEIESMWESETEREIDSVWESESEMIVRLREWEGYWESESDERVRLCGRKGDSKSLSVGVKNRGQKTLYLSPINSSMSLDASLVIPELFSSLRAFGTILTQYLGFLNSSIRLHFLMPKC